MNNSAVDAAAYYHPLVTCMYFRKSSDILSKTFFNSKACTEPLYTIKVLWVTGKAYCDRQSCDN